MVLFLITNDQLKNNNCHKVSKSFYYFCDLVKCDGHLSNTK